MLSMRYRILLFLCSITFIVKAQCPHSQFNVSGAACAGQAISFTNSSTAATSYKWDFCAGDFDSSSTISIFDSAMNLVSPYCATPVIEDGNHYVFVCNRGTNSIIRIDYGNSFNNVALLSTDLGSFGIISSPSGMVF